MSNIKNHANSFHLADRCSHTILKTLLIIFLALTAVGLIPQIGFPVASLAQQATLTVGTGSGVAGTSVDLAVNFVAGGASVSTMQFDLTLPPGFSLGGIATGSAAVAAGKTANDSTIPGGVRVLIFGLNQNAIGSGPVVVVSLNIAGNSAFGTFPVGITGIVASDPLGYSVATAGSGGSVSVTAASDTAPPVISGVAAGSITQSGATIAWTTNEGGDTQVEYGTTASYGGSTALNTGLVTSHSTSLSGLTASTLYHYRVKSRDAAGNLGSSADFTLTTLAWSTECAPANVRCVAEAPGSTQEYATIQAAADAALPGDTVLVYDGNYAGFEVSSSGTSAAPIRFKAAALNAVINVDGPTGDSIRLQNVSYVSVEGFHVESPSQRCVAAMGAGPATPMLGLSIRNNTCHASAAEGIFLSDVSGGLIEGNTISNAGRGSNPVGHGISLVEAGSDNTTLRSNVITASSGDGVNASGNASAGGDGLIRGLLLEDNTISGGSLNGVGLDGVQDAVVQNNLVYGNGRSAVRGYQSIGAQGPHNLTVVNNTLLTSASGEFAIRLTEDLGGHTLFNNILLSDNASGGSVAVSNRSMVSSTNGVVDRFSLDGGATVITLAEWQTAGYDGGSFVTTGADLFVNAAGNDYHLKAASPAIDVGRGSFAGVTAPVTDLEGNTRPRGYGYDVGALESSFQAADTTPPVISGITATTITTAGATINWKTDEVADSQVEYGTTTNYGTVSTLNSSLVTNHSMVLGGLSPGTTYYFRVRSRDGSGNLAISAGFSLTTQVAVQALAISNVGVTNVRSRQATIKWTTNLPSTSQVEFGASIRLGSLSALNSTLVTAHAVTLNNLKAGKTYYFRVRSKDAKGNLVVSSVSSFIAVR
ncbi:MAG: fibronectin type III domain-containing protein [Terriglobia bacterium]